jgi:hypothetical protein
MDDSYFAPNGTLFAGDSNYKLYRSDNYGASFRLIYQFPQQSNPNSAVAGYVWNIFVDSRNNLFVSIPGTNRLYRSTNFGSSFSQVLNTNGAQNDGFYIATTEDSNGNLYTATYSNSIYPNAPTILKSTNGGSSWSIVFSAAAVHFHNVKFNPANGYLYAITGEWGQGYNNQNCERIFRSKDGGRTWTTVINRPVELQARGSTIYNAMIFNGNWVYIGSDQAYEPNWIDRFYDDGSGPFTPQTVYNFPSDGSFPVISGVWLNNVMVFSSTAEFSDGTSRVVASDDGLNWQIVKSTATTQTLHHTNVLTSNPKGIAFGSDGPGNTFSITDGAQPTPTPTATPTPTPSPSPTPTATPSPSGVIFQNGFESGNFNAWTATGGAGSYSTVVEANNPYNGTYNAKFTAGANSEGWCTVSIANSPIIYMQQYVKLGALPTSGNQLYLGTIQSTSSNNNVDVFVENSGGQYYWGVYSSINGATYNDRESTPSNPSTGKYYCIESMRDVTHGLSALWVDGSAKVSVSRSNSGNANKIYSGITWTSSSATVYTDFVTVSTNFISFSSSPQPTPSPTTTPTPTPSATPTPTPTTTPTPTPTPTATPTPNQTSIFSDSFETGTFGSWTGTKSAGSGVTQSVKNTSPYQGTYADQVTVADGSGENGVCIYKDLGSSYSTIDARVYVKLSAKPTTGSVLEILGFSSNGWLPDPVGARVDVENSNGLLQWRLVYYNNGWQTALTGSISLNTWYCLEVKLVIGSGIGQTRLYINGVESLTETGLTNTAPGSSVRYLTLGADDEIGSNSLTVYFDSVIAAASYIGT